jgi:predicted nuclease with TOPRIM domain
MTGTINDLIDENAGLKTKVEALEAALKERLRFMKEHFEQYGKELGLASGEIDVLEARWEKLKNEVLQHAKWAPENSNHQILVAYNTVADLIIELEKLP